MPELPEVEVVRRSLERHVLGRRVTAVDGSGLGLRAPVDVPAWRRLAVGRRLDRLTRRGKYLIVEAQDAALVFHLGMSGRLVAAPAASPRAAHAHLVVALDGGRELRFVDPRRFGLAVAMPLGALAAFPPLAGLGPDPLREDCTLALQAARRSRVAIRNVLLDQRVLAGVGNIYASEALFRAAIHPATPADRLGPRRVDRLAAAVRAVLEEAIRAGGTTLADGGFIDADGEAGYFAVDLAVYGRAGLPCRRCGRKVVRRQLTGRSTYHCPGCQRR